MSNRIYKIISVKKSVKGTNSVNLPKIKDLLVAYNASGYMRAESEYLFWDLVAFKLGHNIEVTYKCDYGKDTYNTDVFDEYTDVYNMDLPFNKQHYEYWLSEVKPKIKFH